MLERFLNWIRGVFSKVINANNVQKALQVDVAVSDAMSSAISLWDKIYNNNAPWLFNQDGAKNDLRSLNLGATIAGEFSRLMLVEFRSNITGSPRATMLDAWYQQNIKSLRAQSEYGNAKGGLIIKPFISGNRILFDYVQAGYFIPVAFSSDKRMTAAVFLDVKQQGKYWFKRLEYHQLTNVATSTLNALRDGTEPLQSEAEEPTETVIRITNRVYRSTSEGELGREASLADVNEWASLEPESYLRGADRLLFGYYRVPFANTIDDKSPLGVSVYSRAVEIMKDADEQYSRAMWEYEGGELAVHVDDTILKTQNGRARRDKLSNRLYRGLNTIGSAKDMYQVFSPQLRDESLYRGLNEILRRIEFNCSLSYGTISDPGVRDLTAEEVRTSQHRSYSAVSELQEALEDALDDAVYAMNYWASFIPGVPAGSYSVAHTWGDSILTNEELDRARFREDIRLGLRQKWEYLVRFDGFTEDEAKAHISAAQTGDASLFDNNAYA